MTENSTALSFRSPWLSALLVLLAGVLVHSNSFENPFVFDDKVTIEDSPNVRALPDVIEAMGAPDGSCASGRPLVALSLAANHSMAENWVPGISKVVVFHAFNLLVHVLAGLILLALARSCLGPSLPPGSGEVLALAVALFWVVHPLHTAALNHISYRTETMVAFFYLGTLYAATRRWRPEASPGWSVVAIASCALGMASKEIMVSAPALVFAWDALIRSGSWRSALRRHWGLHAGLAATWAILAWSISTGDRGGTVGLGAQGVSSFSYLLTESEVLLRYLKLVFWPAPLMFEASDWPIAKGLGEVWPASLVVAALFAASLVFSIRRKPLGLVALAVFAVLAPTSSVIPITGAPMAEHRMVLPLAGVLVLAVLALHRFLRRVPAPVSLVLAIATTLSLGWLSYQRNSDYRSGVILWEDTAAKRPNNPRAFEHLGLQRQAAGDLLGAEEAFRRSIELDPEQPKTLYNLALLLRGVGREAEAAPYFALAQEQAPGMSAQQFRSGWQAFSLGRIRGGVANMRSALQINPELVERPKLQRACAQLARVSAIATEAEIFDPAFAASLASQLTRALEERSNSQDLAFRARVWDTLAASHSALGDRLQAVSCGQRALSDAKASGDVALQAQVAEHLTAYETGRSLRVPVLSGTISR